MLQKGISEATFFGSYIPFIDTSMIHPYLDDALNSHLLTNPF